MQVSIETTSGLERRLTVGVPADELIGAVDAVCKKQQRMFAPGLPPRQGAMKSCASASALACVRKFWARL